MRLKIAAPALAGVTVAAALLASPAAADPYRWCAQYGRDGGRNCGFVTLQQCQATVSGVGGFCERNAFYTGPDRPVRRGRKADRHRRAPR